jgi:alanyl-tRNA synthetase
MAIFEEKYGDVVRVLTMTRDSVELCGGTHCRSLGEIGMFKILSEAGTAAGVRRILAVTGANAIAHVRRVEDELRRARASAKVTGGADLIERIERMATHERQLEKRVKELEKQLLEGGSGGGGIDAMLAKAVTVSGIKVLGVRVADGTDMAALRELAEKLRDKLGEEAVVLGAAKSGDKAQLVLMVSKASTSRLKAGALIRPIAEKVRGSGGGRPDMAQAGGANPDGIDDAVAALVPAVSATLGA